MKFTGKERVFIKSAGAYLPEKVLSSSELEQKLGLENGWIESKTGIKARRIAANDESVSTLAARAGLDALKNAGMNASDIDMLIVSSSMGDMFFPSTACIVQNMIGASGAAFDLNNACAGFLYGVNTAAAYVASGAYRNVMVIGAETMSRMVDWNDYKTCILFGDAAGACVISAEGDHRILGMLLGADGSGAEALKLPGGGSRAPFRDAENKADSTIYMEGGTVFRFAMKIIGEIVRNAAEEASLNLRDINLIVPHQSNRTIIREAASILGVAEEKFYLNLPEVGNTACASVPVALADAISNNAISAGDKIVLASYGAGLAYASAVVEW